MTKPNDEQAVSHLYKALVLLADLDILPRVDRSSTAIEAIRFEIASALEDLED